MRTRSPSSCRGRRRWGRRGDLETKRSSMVEPKPSGLHHHELLLLIGDVASYRSSVAAAGTVLLRHRCRIPRQARGG
ncbi:hypothetical protein E2562_028012 [Oryza meyeriana var. granulata]|uniref:Uncharacterized protein n=1 Tax=Oryza meyeriana var. granulata TaxID=110450 RepID=A0A6G1CT07_9ORYZ|nr:hypothetical protein E2562_028012 [Oryza meyeriana var. granulata]